MTKKNTLTIRITDEFDEELEELCKTWRLNRTQVIERLVHGAYVTDTKVGKEKIQGVLDNFKILNESLLKLNEEVK